MAPAGPLVVGRKGNADVAVVEDRIMLAVSLLDLVQGLRDQESAHAVSGHEGEAGLEEIQTTERRELVEHRSEEHTSELQSLMRSTSAVFCLQKNYTFVLHIICH